MGAWGADGTVDAYVDDLDALVAALREDPVHVQQVRGNGHTAEVDAALTRIVESSDIPVYVALVGNLPDLAVDDPTEDLGIRLQSQLDPDAVYVVAVGSRGTDFHYGGSDPDLAHAIYEGLKPTYPDWEDEDAPRASDAGRAAILASIVADEDHTVSEELVDTYTSSATWTQAGYRESKQPYLHVEVVSASVFVGVLVALVGWRLTRTWALRAVTAAPPAPQRGRKPPASTVEAAIDRPGADLETVRRDATSTLDKLAAELTARPNGPGVDDALGCRVAAEQVLGSHDLLDVVGALVLARTGRALLKDHDRPYRPCFVNPLHGRGYLEIDLPAGGGSVAVPVCRRCSEARSSSRRRPDALLEPRSSWLPMPDRPYYEGDTVWARTGYGSLDPDLWRHVTQERR
ncbi:hypothetical protein [Nocardioides sp. cx-173]|uniref:hypothetical protein n=1 Tax=Nocardioides sp. cx-173 TaxID=2898796 RepID=UPI001E613016|nr:hypothetical protein [Nocardioides sp. cx-173]MCD4525891.1 hypothetical protein [Nocardioides sp. cx-173]UGB40042.1 hypothetical protein LQ940_11585 [Nocardioides sp. cx-173]